MVFESPARFERWVFAAGSGARLDVDLFLVGVDEPVAATFDPLRAALAAAGLELGELRFRPVTGAPAERLAVLDGDRGRLPELAELHGLGAGLPPGLPVFLVRHVDYYLGLTGGVPIPLAMPGAPGAGVVVGADDAGDALGLVLAHEVGHALGLFHPTESDGSTREPLPDTPRCTDDADGDGTFAPDECTGAGAENLMFWSLERATPALSANQGAVVRTAPILR